MLLRRFSRVMVVLCLSATALVESPFVTAPSVAHAAGLVVNTTADAPDASPADGICASTLIVGGCTLRAAIQTANAMPGFNTITIADSLTSGSGLGCVGPTFTLTVAGSTLDDNAATGDLDVTDPLYIDEQCVNGATVDAGGASGIQDRVFEVFASLDMYQVRSTGGYSNTMKYQVTDQPPRGAGIYVHTPAHLTLYRSNVTGNGVASAATTDTWKGGGVYAEKDTDVTITNSIVDNNTASLNGGGIYTDGALHVSGFAGSISNNTAGDGGIGGGGGVFLGSDATAEIGGVTATTNFGHGSFLSVDTGASATLWDDQITDGSGSGILMAAGSHVGVSDTLFKSNVDTNGGGGAVDNPGGTLTVVDSGFVANQSSNGGAVYNTGSFEMQRSFATGNSATSIGGFLENQNEGTVRIVNSSIGNNTAAVRGGGIWTGAQLELEFVTMEFNTATTNSGGGLYVLPTTTATIRSSVIASNPAGGTPTDCDGNVQLFGTNVLAPGGCNDTFPSPGGGARIDGTGSNPGWFPAVASFDGSGGQQVPQFVNPSVASSGTVVDGSCTRVGVDGYGYLRQSICDPGATHQGALAGSSAVTLTAPATVPTVAPAFDTVALANLPASAVGAALGTANNATAQAAPLARVDLSQPLTGTADVETSPLARVPLARVPLARVPLARVPLARVGLASIPLARVPLARVANNPGALDTWPELLAESTLANRPLTSVTFADIFDPLNWPVAGSFDRFTTAFNSLTLEQVDLSSTVIGRMSVDAISVADVPLADLPLGGTASGNRTQNLTAWCTYFASIGYPCAATFGIDPQQPDASDDINLTVAALVGVPLARVPLARVPLARVPLARVPILNTPLARVDYQNTPLARVPLARVDLTSTPLARVPLARSPLEATQFEATPLARVSLLGQDSLEPPTSTLPQSLLDRRLSSAYDAKIDALINCSVIDCAHLGTLTLGDAFHTGSPSGVNGILSGATIFDLLNAYDDLTFGEIAPWILLDPETTVGDLPDLGSEITAAQLIAAIASPEIDQITLGAVLNGFVPRDDVAWDNLDLKDPDLAGVQGGTFNNAAGTGTTVFSVTVSRDPAPAVPDIMDVQLPTGFRVAPDGIRVNGALVPSSQITEVDGKTEFPVNAHGAASIVQVTAYTGLTTGQQNATFTVHAGGTTGVEASATPTVNVAESFEPNDTPAQAATAVGGTSINPDQLYVSTIGTPGDVDLWPILVPRGDQLSVAVSGMSQDYDVVVYSPPGATEDPQVELPDGLRQVPDRSADYLPDFGLGLGRDDTRVQPQLLQDIPLQAGRKVFAASVDRGTAPERIDTPALGGGIYLIQVTGYNGASGPDPYSLRASVRSSIATTTCATTRPNFQNAAPPSLTGSTAPGATTLFVVNSQRLDDSWGLAATAPLYTELNSTLSAINGNQAGFGGGAAKVLDVSGLSAVNNAYLAWDADRCTPAKANGVVKAIGGAIDTATTANGTPFKNIVLIGADDIIPMARVVDGTTLGNEREYSREFNANTDLSSSLSYGTVLTDDPYADAKPISVAGSELYVPNIAIGRLVEAPAEITRSLNQYRMSSGILDASTAAVTGYDFLSDGATAVKAALSANLPGGVPDYQISETWSKHDLQAILGNAADRLLSINAHFDNNEALPADQNAAGVTSDPVRTTDLTDDGGLRMLFSMGCHAGLSVSDVSLGVNSADESLKPDWASALAANGDLLVGNTGYGYGDTDTVAASEKLMTFFAQRLDGSVTIGDALQLSKERYSADLPVLTPYDEKVLQEVVMYGLPMYRLSGTATPPRDRPDGVDPQGAVGGLQTTGFNVDITPTDDGNPATPSFSTTTTDRGTFWSVTEDPSNKLENSGRVLTAQYRPIQPQYAVEATDTSGNGTEARGALITSLASTDVPNVNPVNFRPTIDLTANEPEPAVDDAAFPDRIQGLTSFSDLTGNRQQLILSTGQFIQDSSSVSGAGTQRLFTHVGGTIYYEPTSNPDVVPPTFGTIDSTNAPGHQATFTVHVDDASGVSRVVVLSTERDHPADWQYTDLTHQANGSWTGSAAVPSVGTEVLYFVQALDANGNVAVSSNKAAYYVAAPVDNDPPTVTAVAQPSAPFTNQPVTVTISANDGPTGTGVASISYAQAGVITTVQNTNASPFVAQVSVTAPGTNVITYSATDLKGNVSATGSITVTIDTTPPTVAPSVTPAPNAAGWVTTPPIVSALVTQVGDAPGIPTTYASTGALAVPPTSYTDPITVTAQGASTLTFTAGDAAGNSAAASVGVKFDSVAPDVSLTVPVEGTTYTTGQDVTAAYTCSDATSGIVPTLGCAGTVANGAAIPTSTPGSFIFTVTATDNAGNATVKTVNYTVATPADSQPPTVVLAVSPAANAAGWIKTSPATISATVTQVGPSLAAPTKYSSTGAFTVGSTTYTGPIAVTAQGQSTVTVVGSDEAGNMTTKSVTFNLDSIGPTVTISTPVSTPSYATGQAVAVAYTCADVTSGILPSTGCTAKITTSTGTVVSASVASGGAIPTNAEGSFIFTVTATDIAGNVTTKAVNYTVADKSAPTVSASVSPAANAAGWIKTSPATVTATVTQVGPSAAAQTRYSSTGALVVAPGTPYSAPISVTAQGTSTLTFNGSDVAGNSASTSATVNLDSVAPSIAITTPTATQYSWNSAVTASFACSDLTSGVPASACTGPATVPTNAVGSFTYTVTATDLAGNVTTKSVNYTVADKSAPTVAVGVSPTANAAGWNNSAPTVTATVTQIGPSPAAQTTYSSTGALVVAAGTSYTAPVVLSAQGTSTLTFVGKDQAGNSASTPVTVKVDTAAPTIVLATPATGATYANGQAVTASFACSDALSGIVTSTGCAGTKANGIAVPTTTAGTFTFTVTATDIAGNVTTKSVTYTVRPANTAPVVAADWGQGARDVGFYNDTAIINGSFTDVNDSGPWTMTIDFGKGTPVVVTRATSGAFSFTSPSYGSAAGTFTAKVKVCDSANLCSTDTVTVRTKVPLSSVRPSMQCVTDSGPSTPQSTPRFTARFNWKNTQAYWVYSPVGVTNAFLPLFIDRGQPTLFKPGSNTTPVTGQFYVFGVGWYLGDTLAVITANSPRC
ncbi:MAG: hypothetical protein JWL72_3800 [Ilumatobacteraceae bacterium]|nr:hypothetical protein [Ilumatobacteraceae bacterium]